MDSHRQGKTTPSKTLGDSQFRQGQRLFNQNLRAVKSFLDSRAATTDLCGTNLSNPLETNEDPSGCPPDNEPVSS